MAIVIDRRCKIPPADRSQLCGVFCAEKELVIRKNQNLLN